MKILFVCLGNICRSPMAHAIMRHELPRHNLSNVIVDSCGTGSWHLGAPPHKGTQKILDSSDIVCDDLVSRRIRQSDFYEYDLIIGMDNQNVRDLVALSPNSEKHKIKLFLDSVETHTGEDVPDPWYTGDFNETFSLISTGVTFWIQDIKKRQSSL